MAYPSDLARTKNWGTEILTDADLEGQFDLIINWVMAALDDTTGHAHDGTSNNGPKIDTGGIADDAVGLDQLDIATVWEAIYPVGIVVTLGVSTNPATLFGMGTWEQIKGKVIVGIDDSGTFDTLDATGGEETHTLTVDEMPAHTHSYTTKLDESSTGYLTEGGVDAGSVRESSSTGGGDPHNNLQPYIVKYVWQRTA